MAMVAVVLRDLIIFDHTALFQEVAPGETNQAGPKRRVRPSARATAR